MIYIKSIRDVERGEYDYTWAITRSNKVPVWMTNIQELSPSWDLFNKYRELAAKGQWNLNTFKTLYVPQFLRELNNPASRKALNTLVKLDRHGASVCLVCFCPGEQLCHRSIIAGILQGAGCYVVTEAGTDYSSYYEMFNGESSQ